jgi:hypothetical protein
VNAHPVYRLLFAFKTPKSHITDIRFVVNLLFQDHCILFLMIQDWYPRPLHSPLFQTEIYIPKNKYEINSHTQRFQDTVYNFIHNCILNYIHTETNLSLDQLIVSKYSALIMITTCFIIHMKNFVSIDVMSPLIYPSIKVQ